MTLRLGIRKLQRIRLLKEVQQPRLVSSIHNQCRKTSDSRNNNSNKQFNGNFRLHSIGVGGIASIIAGISLFQHDLKAEEKEEIDIEQEIIDKENRIRQYSRIETIFDYFSTYKTQTPKGITTIVMSVKDFYNACTPWSTITHGVGRGTYALLTKEDIMSARTYELEKLPPKPDSRYSVLNEIQMHGMLTFQDFVFLLNLLSTPRRYLDTGFHCFDVSADGKIEAKEFAHVMATITDYKGNLSDLTNCEYSGLMNYLFGKDRDKTINQEDFIRLQRDLEDDIMWLEFSRYSKDGRTISDLDLCNHLLCCANLTTKQRRQMINHVKRDVEGDSLVGRITYEAFKNFYLVLFGGTDLERAMFFLDTEKKGVNREEFMSIAKSVANCDIERHIVDVIYALLDDNQDGNLSIKEFSPVMFQWRRSRGFEHAIWDPYGTHILIHMGNLSA